MNSSQDELKKVGTFLENTGLATLTLLGSAIVAVKLWEFVFTTRWSQLRDLPVLAANGMIVVLAIWLTIMLTTSMIHCLIKAIRALD